MESNQIDFGSFIENLPSFSLRLFFSVVKSIDLLTSQSLPSVKRYQLSTLCSLRSTLYALLALLATTNTQMIVNPIQEITTQIKRPRHAHILRQRITPSLIHALGNLNFAGRLFRRPLFHSPHLRHIPQPFLSFHPIDFPLNPLQILLFHSFPLRDRLQSLDLHSPIQSNHFHPFAYVYSGFGFFTPQTTIFSTFNFVSSLNNSSRCLSLPQ